VSDAPAAKRRVPVGLIGGVLIAAAALLVVLVAVPRHPSHVDAGAEATTACRAFDDVYGATKPSTPMAANALAAKLDFAIDHMHRAASADARWRTLAGSLDTVGNAVNADDANESYTAMQDAHRRCETVLNPGVGRA